MSSVPEAFPDLDEVRPLLLEGLAFAGKIAALTPTALDDQAITAATDIVNGPLFGLAWNFLKRKWNRAAGEAIAPEAADDLAELEAAAPEGVPILTIIAAIEMAWKLIALIRARRAG